MRPLDYDGGAYFNAAAYEVHHCTRITYTYKVHTVQGGGRQARDVFSVRGARFTPRETGHSPA